MILDISFNVSFQLTNYYFSTELLEGKDLEIMKSGESEPEIIQVDLASFDWFASQISFTFQSR